MFERADRRGVGNQNAAREQDSRKGVSSAWGASHTIGAQLDSDVGDGGFPRQAHALIGHPKPPARRVECPFLANERTNGIQDSMFDGNTQGARLVCPPEAL